MVSFNPLFEIPRRIGPQLYTALVPMGLSILFLRYCTGRRAVKPLDVDFQSSF
ncbi:hypothetical protein P186_0944 [Pyrobaculum ferrireducens]|uniref:Uncharacterized protein n=1 Tax=Pyrobaculum ferrireducens TaxID=1104324 RepID=G7VBF5_9CREN|nr:hypothetical protein P186_0944 [Pyrobaculum ferrireducens]